MDEWKVEDDILLCTAVEQGALLDALAYGVVEFSSSFTVDQIRNRWKALLYDPKVAYPAAAAMEKARERPDIAALAAPQPSVMSLCATDTAANGPGGTGEAPGSPLPASFSDVETVVLEHEQPARLGPAKEGSETGPGAQAGAYTSGQGQGGARAEKEQRVQRQKDMWMMVQLERTAEMCTARRLAKTGALGALQGSRTKFLITKPEVSIGRSTDEQQVDIDLSEEGNASKVSRQQAVIKLVHHTMRLYNTGRRQILVNNCIVESGKSRRLESKCLVEVGGLRFLFLMNKYSIRKLGAQAEQVANPNHAMLANTPNVLNT